MQDPVKIYIYSDYVAHVQRDSMWLYIWADLHEPTSVLQAAAIFLQNSVFMRQWWEAHSIPMVPFVRARTVCEKDVVPLL